MTATADMAKKKAAKRGAKPKQGPLRDELITMRCTKAYKDWVEGIAGQEQRLASVVIERALKRYAEENGYGEPPER